MKLTGITAELAEANRIKEAGKQARAERDRLLAGCDWTQVADAPVDKAAWAIYRAALRDVPQQPGFPDDINWPEIPGVTPPGQEMEEE
jgi:hypothetical protein